MDIMRIMETLKNMVVGSLVDGDSLMLEKDEDVVEIIDLFDFRVQNNEIVLCDIKNLNELRIDLDEYEIKAGYEFVEFTKGEENYKLSFI